MFARIKTLAPCVLTVGQYRSKHQKASPQSSDSYISNIHSDCHLRVFYFSFQRGIMVLLRAGIRDSYFPRGLQTGSVTHSASYSMDTKGRGVKLATRLHILPKLWLRGAYLHFPTFRRGIQTSNLTFCFMIPVRMHWVFFATLLCFWGDEIKVRKKEKLMCSK